MDENPKVINQCIFLKAQNKNNNSNNKILRDQERFILRMKGWFNIRKIYQCNLTQIKEINLRAISINALKKEINILYKNDKTGREELA